MPAIWLYAARMARSILLLSLVLTLVLTACGSDGGDGDVLRQGRSVYGDTCSVCHGNRGQGGVGPALDTVLETWPDCENQIAWIALGSEGWRAAHGESYGAGSRPVTGGMPAQGDQLSDREIRLVAAFQRIEYGGQDRDEALAACGVVPGS